MSVTPLRKKGSKGQGHNGGCHELYLGTLRLRGNNASFFGTRNLTYPFHQLAYIVAHRQSPNYCILYLNFYSSKKKLEKKWNLLK